MQITTIRDTEEACEQYLSAITLSLKVRTKSHTFVPQKLREREKFENFFLNGVVACTYT